MTNIILTSEMRVGSRWLHYLLRDVLNMRVSGELDVSDIPKCQELVTQRFKEKRIVKFHHAKLDDLEKIKGDYKIIALVRNPRDRIVSWTFHQRFKPEGLGMKAIKEAPNDKEAVRACIGLSLAQKHNEDQFPLMIRMMSTKQYKKGTEQKYIWTCYHWLKTDPVGEITKIVDFLGLEVKHAYIEKICGRHSFKARSGRNAGSEQRKNEWFRKGVEMDYLNWFDDKMLKQTEFISNHYWEIIKNEEGNENNSL